MATFRLCFLYGATHLVTIAEQPISLKSLRETIVRLLPPFRELSDYLFIVSGKPPCQLDLNDEEKFNEHRTLITDGSYLWMKLISLTRTDKRE